MLENFSKNYYRICFEPKENTNINDSGKFRSIAEKYLEMFFSMSSCHISYAGFVAINAFDKHTNNMEPLWQYILQSDNLTHKDFLVNYVNNNDLPEYYIHVYQHTNEGKELKIL